MKAILMAAGVGTRISRYINEIPKSTVEIRDGVPLISHTVRRLRESGIDDISVVIGYRHQLVRDALRDHAVRFIVNPFFHQTNSVASLWFAREALDDDVLFMNADTFIEDRVLDLLLRDERSPVMLADSSRPYGEMDYKLGCEGHTIRLYGKELAEADADMEYVGAARVSRGHISAFRKRLEEMIDSQRSDCWWEDVLYGMTHEGRDVYVADVAGLFWAEVDYFEDYLRIRQFMQS